MEILFSPVSLALMAYLYYVARKEGQLTFRLSGWDSRIEEWLEIVYRELADVTKDMSREERQERIQEATSKLREPVSEHLTDIRFSRLKVHDLKKAMTECIDIPDQTWKRLDAEEAIRRCFDAIIRKYDSQQKVWN